MHGREHGVAAETSGARALAVLTATIALLAAVIYVLMAGAKMYVQGQFANVSRDLVWMSPLSNLFWYFAGWVALVAIARIIGAQRGFAFGVWALLAMFSFSLFLRFTAIHRVAAIIFAAGVATVAVRVYRQAPDVWLRRARVTRNALGAAFLVATVVVLGRRALSQRELPPAVAGAPNVLLLVLDCVRGDLMQATGYARGITPFLDSLALRSAHFANAFSTAPWTLPSHGSMFTGEYPGRLNATLRIPLDDTHPTIGEHFSGRGYYTYGLTGNLHYTSWESGLARGFAEWHDYERSMRQVLRSSEIGQIQMILEIIDASSWRDVVAAIRRHAIYVHPKPEAPVPVAGEMTDTFLAWHAQRPDRPFLAFINYYDAHFPYAPPAPYRRRFGDTTARDLYDGEVAYIDDELRRLFGELRQRGALENTYVVITSDHGELFGEQGRTTHGNSLFTPVLHVPLIVAGPGIEPHRVSHPVTIRDIPATIAELTGIGVQFPGASLTGYFRDSTFRSSPALAWLGQGEERMVSYLDEEFQLIQQQNREFLFRYRADPLNEQDLIAVDSLRHQLERMRADLARLVGEQTAITSRPADRR